MTLMSLTHLSSAAAVDLFEHLPTTDERRLLEMLAASEDGATDALLLAQGFTLDLMVNLVHAGFVTADSERIFAGRDAVEVSRVRITDAGRRALAQRDA